MISNFLPSSFKFEQSLIVFNTNLIQSGMNLDRITADQYIRECRKQAKICNKSMPNQPPPISYPPVLAEYNNEFDKYVLPSNLHPDPEWSHNLTQWFAYVRHDVNQIKKEQSKNQPNNSPEKNELSELITKIESTQLPNLDTVISDYHFFGILSYFQKRHTKFDYSDLCWIFSALIRINKLMQPEMCECIQTISALIRKQICEDGSENSLFPYLSVIHELILKYFRQF